MHSPLLDVFCEVGELMVLVVLGGDSDGTEVVLDGLVSPSSNLTNMNISMRLRRCGMPYDSRINRIVKHQQRWLGPLHRHHHKCMLPKSQAR